MANGTRVVAGRLTAFGGRVALGVLATSVLLFAVLVSSASAAGPVTRCDLQALDTPSHVGDEVRFRFQAANEPEVPGPVGLVSYFDGIDPIPFDTETLVPDGINLDHSTAIARTSSLSKGDHTIRAVFLPGPGSTPCPPGRPNTVNQTVLAATSTTTVSSSANPSKYQQNVTFSAHVAKSGGGTGTGTVQFKADGNDIGGPQTVDGSGNASVSTSSLSKGNHSITADFTSDNPGTVDSSGSLAGGQTVEAADTTTGVTSSVNPSEFGQAVTFTATVSPTAPGSGTPDGTVQFQDNGTDLGSPKTVDGSGKASITTTEELSVGDHTIKAVYTPANDNYNGSDGQVDQQVKKARTALAYTGPTTGEYNAPVTLSGKLTRKADGSGVAGKSIQFTLGTQSCSGTTSASGDASCSVTLSQAPGDYTVKADFAGDSNYDPSSDSKAFTITKAHSKTTLSADPPSPSTFGQAVKFTAAVSGVNPGGATPTGSVTFKVDGTPVGSPALSGGSASVTTSSLSAGSHTIDATYSGDSFYLDSSDSRTHTVTCAVNVSGSHAGSLTVTKSTCITNAQIRGKIIVQSGGSLDLESSSVAGLIDADASNPPGTIRICNSSTSGSGAVQVRKARGLVIIGDPGRSSCAPNTFGAALIVKDNKNGVMVMNNKVRGPIVTTGNSGPGPYPGDTTTISGNHH